MLSNPSVRTCTIQLGLGTLSSILISPQIFEFCFNSHMHERNKCNIRKWFTLSHALCLNRLYSSSLDSLVADRCSLNMTSHLLRSWLSSLWGQHIWELQCKVTQGFWTVWTQTKQGFIEEKLKFHTVWNQWRKKKKLRKFAVNV